MDHRQELIAKLREVAGNLGRTTVSCNDFVRATGINGGTILRHFDSWRDLCRQAGVDPYPRNVKVTEDEIFAAMRDAFLAQGGVTAQHRFLRSFRYSSQMLYSRGWGWREAQAAFRRWVERNDPAFPYLDQLATAVPVKPARAKARGHPGPPPLDALRVMGAFIDFPGLSHAPVNESGVILLFGMVARALGFVVEQVGASFPDCEAKRRVAGERWERVRIEFEYRSLNFRDHGHDATRCDLIVCWEDNWPDCPVEVLELKRIVREMARRMVEEGEKESTVG